MRGFDPQLPEVLNALSKITENAPERKGRRPPGVLGLSLRAYPGLVGGKASPRPDPAKQFPLQEKQLVHLDMGALGHCPRAHRPQPSWPLEVPTPPRTLVGL